MGKCTLSALEQHCKQSLLYIQPCIELNCLDGGTHCKATTHIERHVVGFTTPEPL